MSLTAEQIAKGIGWRKREDVALMYGRAAVEREDLKAQLDAANERADCNHRAFMYAESWINAEYGDVLPDEYVENRDRILSDGGDPPRDTTNHCKRCGRLEKALEHARSFAWLPQNPKGFTTVGCIDDDDDKDANASILAGEGDEAVSDSKKFGMNATVDEDEGS